MADITIRQLQALNNRKSFDTSDSTPEPLSVVKPEPQYEFVYDLHTGPNGRRRRIFTTRELIDFLMLTTNIKLVSLTEVE